jgi:hypothetical protein
MNDSKAASFTESQLRHPLERPYFLASVVLSLIVVAVGIVIILFAPEWLKSHALLSKEATAVRAALIAALAGLPLLALLRHRRDVYIHGQSIRLSRNQFAPIYEILEKQCQRLGMTEVPGLYITDKGIPPYSKAFSTRSDHSIVLHQNLFEVISKNRSTSRPLPSVANSAGYGSGIPTGWTRCCSPTFLSSHLSPIHCDNSEHSHGIAMAHISPPMDFGGCSLPRARAVCSTTSTLTTTSSRQRAMVVPG